MLGTGLDVEAQGHPGGLGGAPVQPALQRRGSMLDFARGEDAGARERMTLHLTFHVGTEEFPEGIHVVAVGGELDLYTAPDLEQALLGALVAGGRKVVVDLSLTTFIDSVALGVLVSAEKEFRQVGGRMVVACGPDVKRFFEVAGLDRVFEIHPTRAEALAGVRAH